MSKLNLAGLFSLMFICGTLMTGCAEEKPDADADSPTSSMEAPKFNSSESAGALADSGGATVPDMDLAEPDEETNATGELVIGDPAPAIAISKWISGQPVTAYAKDTVHVVEFWATWCGPCLASMPHIAGLQKEYGDKVTFIGVTAEDNETVSGFMEQTSQDGRKWSEVLAYRIALDDDRKTNAAFMEAAGQNGIPCAFIVGKTGLVEWIGHPMEIDQPLSDIVEGNWDLEKAKTIAKEAAEYSKALSQVGPAIDEAISEGNHEKAVSLVEGLIKKFPSNADLPMIRFKCLIGGNLSEEANKSAKALIEDANDDAQQLDQIAWIMATGSEEPGIDLELAVSAAQRAVELTEEKDFSPIETLARVQFQKGNVEEAIELQKKTLQLASDPRQQRQLAAGLAKYEAALKPAEPEPAEPTAENPGNE